MNCTIHTYFMDDKGEAYRPGDTVTIHFTNGGGSGGCNITKITKTGFHYTQGSGSAKSVSFEKITEIRKQ